MATRAAGLARLSRRPGGSSREWGTAAGAVLFLGASAGHYEPV